MLPHLEIQSRLRSVVRAVQADANVKDVLVKPCPDPKFGDYQTVCLMALAKQKRMNPRQLATEVVEALDVGDVCESVEIAGPGFLNFRLKPQVLAQTVRDAAKGDHLFFEKADRPLTVVIDFSSPNIAKAMHVGHIRSTILGDSLARVLRLLGHRVICDNHVGDWGTQFGKLLLGWKTELDEKALEADPIAEMERLYKKFNAACDQDEALLNQARTELVKLQSGDEENLGIWRRMIELSQHQFDAIYARLGVHFDHTLGESYYHARLAAVVEDLLARGIAEESEGAIAVFFKDDPRLKGTPALVRKSDGGFNYTTTDLATLAYRLETWHPDEILYVTDGRQQLHFQQVFAAFRKWKPDANVRLEHVWFGSIQGEDGKPFKARSGEPIKLADLLNEAEERAFAVVSTKSPGMDEAQRREIARVVGLGAVKYSDLLPNRQSDYVFSWDKMLALNGNTAPYLQYAYARIQSIFRKGEVNPDEIDPTSIELVAPEELALARHLLNFGIVLESVAEEQRPNYLCNHLYELAGLFTRFYENCPVLKAEGSTRASRLALCSLTGKVIRQGLDTLGIETLDQM